MSVDAPGTAPPQVHGQAPVDFLTAAPLDRASNLRRWTPAAFGSLTAVATLGVTLWNPGDSGVPLCPSKFIFGFDCPFCGATRATAALARGDLGRALDHNVLWVGLVPFVVAAFAVWMASALRDRPFPTVSVPRWFWATAGVLLLAFGISRNLDVNELTRWLAADAPGV